MNVCRRLSARLLNMIKLYFRGTSFVWTSWKDFLWTDLNFGSAEEVAGLFRPEVTMPVRLDGNYFN